MTVSEIFYRILVSKSGSGKACDDWKGRCAMVFYNGRVFTPAGYVCGGLIIEDGRFTEIVPDLKAGDVDLNGAKVLPGLIDIHTHGNSGEDFADGDERGLRKMASYLARNGITGFAPASMTLPYTGLERAFLAAESISREDPADRARLLGIHMEGPFFSEKKKGAQNSEFLKVPDFDAFTRLFESSGGLIKIVDVAPELLGAIDFIEAASELCRVSIAHTDADYGQACDAFDAGASHLTHLFNAMPEIHHRRPGVIGAASERDHVTAELICDGIHVHPAAVRMAFRLFPERICLISDSLRCCGMDDGDYEFGGQTVRLENHIVRLSDGTIAGSASNLMECLKNAIRFGIREDEAIRASTINPAVVIGADDLIGSIEAGKYADLIICDDSLNIEQIYIGGHEL